MWVGGNGAAAFRRRRASACSPPEGSNHAAYADHQLIRGCAMLIDLADNPTPPAPPCVPCTLERRPAALF